MTTQNEAAERLRRAIRDLPDSVPEYRRDQLRVYLDGALHEQAEQIRDRLADALRNRYGSGLWAHNGAWPEDMAFAEADAILEAAR